MRSYGGPGGIGCDHRGSGIKAGVGGVAWSQGVLGADAGAGGGRSKPGPMGSRGAKGCRVRMLPRPGVGIEPMADTGAPPRLGWERHQVVGATTGNEREA